MKKKYLYVHIPFCEKKCPFCSFAVVVNQQGKVDEYLEALSLEAEWYKDSLLQTIYVGGGTPSSLSNDQIIRLWKSLRRNFDLSSVEEITFECNPESVTVDKSKLLIDLGVSRISLGVQSTEDRFLQFLGRGHSRDEAVRAMEILQAAGFENVNLDLMYGFPGQTIVDLKNDIKQILSFSPAHVSVYSLTVEERSLFFVRKQEARESSSPDFYQTVVSGLEQGGLLQYEISNFARPGQESVHNINYWEGGQYIGLGMAAHSHCEGRRFWNADTLPVYLEMMKTQGHAIAGEEQLAPAKKMIETLLFGLRMNRGVDLARLQQDFGCVFSAEMQEDLENLIELGLLEERDPFLRCTAQGRLVLDEISARLV